MSNFGTSSQQEYGTKLAIKANFESLEAACEAQTGRPLVNLGVTPFTKEQASLVITFLERRLSIPPKPAKPLTDDKPHHSTVNGEEKKYTSKYLTAKHLRLIATHKEVPPAELDDDAKWVLARLHRLDAIEAFVRRGQPDQKLSVNANEQIKVSHLVEYFGSEEMTADAFSVSVQTLRAWGPLLPPAHAFKAEVLTHGYVTVPRP